MKEIKKGFSLPEALVLLIIVAICALLVPHLFIKKYERQEYEIHGTWECEILNGSYTQTLRDVDGVVKRVEHPTGSCTFRPPASTHDYNVDICGNHAELDNCNYYDGSHVLKYYPTLKRISGIGMKNNRVYFGDYAYAFYRGGLARVLIVF